MKNGSLKAIGCEKILNYAKLDEVSTAKGLAFA